MKIFSFITTLTIVFFSLTAHAGQSRDLLEAFLSKTSRMTAEFQQNLLDQRGILLQQSSGTFTLDRPGKFIWNYAEPYPQQIVSNGKKIWIYDSELEQVTVKQYAQVLAGAPVILLDQRKNLDQEFIVSEEGLFDNQHWVILTPKSKDNEFKQIRVGMQNNILRTMMLVDTFDQTTIIVFNGISINPSLEDTQFEFIPPRGTDVVGDF